jgi:hypothetical protein
VPLVLGLMYLPKLDKNSRILLILLTFATISQFSDFFSEHHIVRFLDQKNDVYRFYNIYGIIDSTIWGFLFYRNSKKKWIKAVILTFVSLQVFTSVYVFSTEGLSNKFYTEFVCLSSLLQLLWVLSYFYERYQREEIRALEKEPMFWFCLGILVYSPTTYFRFVYYEILHDQKFSGLEIIHHLLNTAMYLVFAIGIVVNILPTSKIRNVLSRYRP